MKIYKMPTLRNSYILFRKISSFGIPNPTVLVIIFRFFIWLISFINRGENHYLYAEFQNCITRKRTRSSHKESYNNGTSSSSSDNETKLKFRKHFGTNFNAKFNIRMKTRCEFIIKADNELFQNRTR